MSDAPRDPGKPPLFSIDRHAAARRARAALRAIATSDVTRVADMGIAALVAALALALAMALSPGPGGLRAPGPLARPHLEAKLSCASCHSKEDARGAASACTGCHRAEAHASTRAAHRALAARGELGCVTCHPAHGDAQGVSFVAGDADAGVRALAGLAVRWGPGAEELVSGAHGPVGATVPLVALAACTRCHDSSNARDPIVSCLSAEVTSVSGHATEDGLRRTTTCFDEHQRASVEGLEVLSGGGAGVCARQHEPGRFVAWDAAREAAARTSWMGAPPARARAPWTWVGAAFAAACIALVALKAARQRKSSAPPRDAPLALAASPRVRLPQIDTATCLGCYACVDACPFDVLEIEKYVAVVARPSDCCGVVLCQQVCPNGSLVITEGEPIETRPRVDEHLESLDAPGVFLAGDLTGLPLIKNAIRQGARVIDRIAATLARGKRASGDGGVDVAIIGAGPAGLSASLRAQELGLSYVTLEQFSVAASIKSFPRNKLVFDQPLNLPVEGDLWLRESTKEELLAQWTRIVRTRRLVIREEHRVTKIAKEADGRFHVEVARSDGTTATVIAQRLVLAIGKRGTPRELGARIAPGAESKVSYALADARSFAGQRVVIVGLGDAAMEAAIAIARQPGASVTLSYRGADFARGKARNIAELKTLAAKGRVRIVFASRVAAVDATGVTLEVSGQTETLAADAVIALIGGVASWDLVARAGVRLGGG